MIRQGSKQSASGTSVQYSRSTTTTEFRSGSKSNASRAKLTEEEMKESPQDELKVSDTIMNTFRHLDRDRNGSMSLDELKVMMQSLDGSKWTDAAVTRLLKAMDRDGNDTISLIEFWNFVVGDTTGPNLLEVLEVPIAEERERHEAEKRRKAEEEGKLAEQKRYLEERQWKRDQRKAFVDDLVTAGVSRPVASKLYDDADQDRNGVCDEEELSAFRAYELAAASQIKDLYRLGAKPDEGDLSRENYDEKAVEALLRTFDAWDVDGDGLVSYDDLVIIFKRLNPKMTDKAIRTVIDEADSDKSGYIDIFEFVDWLCGEHNKKKKGAAKKKVEEELQSSISAGLHKRRALEAQARGEQKEFEDAQNQLLAPFCAARKIKMTCDKLHTGPHAPSVCEACKVRHIWCCLGCGFISHFETCIQGCEPGKFGWTCISGKCKGAKCGCKKPLANWKRKGFAMDAKLLSSSHPGTTDHGAS